MAFSPSLVFLFAIILILVSVASLVAGLRLREGRGISVIAMIVALAPGFVLLCLFYSLAIHMTCALGGWPTMIGEGGFPASLKMHANMATSYFEILLLLTLFAWPVVWVGFVSIRPLRKHLVYVAAYAVGFFAAIAAMFLAPSSFLSWWWD